MLVEAPRPDRLLNRRLALVVALVLLAHTLVKARLGTLPELLWGCNVASFLILGGLWTGAARLVGAAFLWHLAVGEPAYAVLVLREGHTGWTSVVAHSVPTLCAFLFLRRAGLPRSAPWLALGLFLALVPLSRALTPPELNINLAHQRLDFLAARFPGTWAYRLVFSAGMLAALLAVDALASRWLGRPGPPAGSGGSAPGS